MHKWQSRQLSKISRHDCITRLGKIVHGSDFISIFFYICLSVIYVHDHRLIFLWIHVCVIINNILYRKIVHVLYFTRKIRKDKNHKYKCKHCQQKLLARHINGSVESSTIYSCSSLHTDVSHETGTTDTGQLASTSIPLAIVPAYKHLKQAKDSQGSVPQVTLHT